jgi:hypothetical protein
MRTGNQSQDNSQVSVCRGFIVVKAQVQVTEYEYLR